MENLFNFGEVESSKQYLQPGIQELTLGGLKMNDDDTGIILKVINEDTEAEADIRLSLKGGAKKWTDVKLKHIGTKLVAESEFNKITNLEELNNLFLGKKLRMKLKGRESMKDGNIKVYVDLSLPPFCERLEDQSKLTFDVNNKYDYEKYQEAPLPSVGGGILNGGISINSADNPLKSFIK